MNPYRYPEPGPAAAPAPSAAAWPAAAPAIPTPDYAEPSPPPGSSPRMTYYYGQPGSDLGYPDASGYTYGPPAYPAQPALPPPAYPAHPADYYPPQSTTVVVSDGTDDESVAASKTPPTKRSGWTYLGIGLLLTIAGAALLALYATQRCGYQRFTYTCYEMVSYLYSGIVCVIFAAIFIAWGSSIFYRLSKTASIAPQAHQTK